MGKTSKFKKLSKMASMLPVIMVNHVQGERFEGYELLKEKGVTKLSDGTRIHPDKSYTKKSVVQKPMNHLQNLKDVYLKHGMNGCALYIREVTEHVAKAQVAIKGEATEVNNIEAEPENVNNEL